MQIPLFAQSTDHHQRFMREAATLVRTLPTRLRFGTSSWTYPGWAGLIYSQSHPVTTKPLQMLAEYVRCPLFRTVGVDSFFYRPPTPRMLEQYREVLPVEFPLVMKVWDQITSHSLRSPRHHGGIPSRAGNANPAWLDASLFVTAILEPALEKLGEHAGVFLFEFEAVSRFTHLGADEFAERLDLFFSSLPRGPRYAVELRSPELLGPSYFSVLRVHGAAHVFNSWTHMPSIGEQLAHEESLTANFTLVRALLRPERTYASAVRAFEPYDRIRDPFPEGHDDILTLINRAVSRDLDIFVIVNNRFEGSSPMTILNLARRIPRAE